MTVDMCCVGLSVAHTKFNGMWVVGLWIVQHDIMLRHAWVFGVDPCRDLFLRTCSVRTEPLKNFAAEERDCSAALLPPAVSVPCPPECTTVLQWPASILKTLVRQCHVQATYIREGALQRI